MLAHEFCTILLKIPDFAVKLQGMTLTAALRAIGRLEAQYEKTEPQTKTVVGKSKAPAPINPIRSAANGRDVNLTRWSISWFISSVESSTIGWKDSLNPFF
jgi:hypothetical protein